MSTKPPDLEVRTGQPVRSTTASTPPAQVSDLTALSTVSGRGAGGGDGAYAAASLAPSSTRRALGFYRSQPSSVRERAIHRALMRLSVVEHSARFRHHTRGWRLDLLSLADDLDEIAADVRRTAAGVAS